MAENMVVTENSPLGPILSFGCISLRETGIMGTLDTQWMGKEVTHLNFMKNKNLLQFDRLDDLIEKIR